MNRLINLETKNLHFWALKNLMMVKVMWRFKIEEKFQQAEK